VVTPAFVEAFVSHATPISVGLAIFAFLVSSVADSKKPLHEHLGRAAAAGAIPSALILMYAAFDLGVLSRVSGLNVPVAFGGMSLLWVSLRAAFQKSK
jgi:hypothetical protein